MNKTQEKSRNVSLTGRAETDGSHLMGQACMQSSQLVGTTRKLSTREQKQLEAKQAEFQADMAKRAEQERHERVQRLYHGLGILEGSFIASLLTYSAIVNEQMNAQGFWESDNFGEKIALIHSELGEATEADRKDLMSDHIPGFSGVEEELADVIIRVVDLAAQKDLRLGEALFAKMRFNLTRPFKHDKEY